jgi:hypothetical protein
MGEIARAENWLFIASALQQYCFVIVFGKVGHGEWKQEHGEITKYLFSRGTQRNNTFRDVLLRAE